MSLMEVKNISAGYSRKMVVENISFEIKEGELIGLLGVNGSGKSTLIKAICNIIGHSGQVVINNTSIEGLKTAELAKIISYVPQQSGIGIDISVLSVVMMGFNSKLRLFEQPTEDMYNKAKAVINLVGLSDVINKNYMLLSQGQKQMVILARALVGQGNMIVMDEPESALDYNIRYKSMNIVKDWIRTDKRAGLVILHDIMLALNNCDRLILLKDKHISDIVDLHNDTIEVMENKLSKIYGNISLVEAVGKNKLRKLIMLCDVEDA